MIQLEKLEEKYNIVNTTIDALEELLRDYVTKVPVENYDPIQIDANIGDNDIKYEKFKGSFFIIILR